MENLLKEIKDLIEELHFIENKNLSEKDFESLQEKVNMYISRIDDSDDNRTDEQKNILKEYKNYLVQILDLIQSKRKNIKEKELFSFKKIPLKENKSQFNSLEQDEEEIILDNKTTLDLKNNQQIKNSGFFNKTTPIHIHKNTNHSNNYLEKFTETNLKLLSEKLKRKEENSEYNNNHQLTKIKLLKDNFNQLNENYSKLKKIHSESIKNSLKQNFEISQNKNEIESLKNIIQSQKNQIEELNKDKLNLEKNLLNEKNNFQIFLKDIEKEFVSMQKTIDTHSFQMNEKDHKINKISKEGISLTDKIKEYEQQIMNCNNQIKELKKEKISLNDKIEYERINNKKESGKLSSNLKSQINKLESQKTDLSTQLENAKNTIFSLKEEIIYKKKDFQIEENETTILKKQIKLFEEEKENFKQKKKHYKQLKLRFAEFEKEIILLKENLKQKNEELRQEKNLKDDLEIINKSLKKQIERLELDQREMEKEMLCFDLSRNNEDRRIGQVKGIN